MDSRIQDTSGLSRKSNLPRASGELQAIASALGAEVYDSQAAGRESGLAVDAGGVEFGWIDPTRSFRVFPKLRR